MLLIRFLRQAQVYASLACFKGAHYGGETIIKLCLGPNENGMRPPGYTNPEIVLC